MSFLLSWLQKKPEKKESSSVIINVAGKKFTLERDSVLRCGNICQKYAREFANREKQGRAIDLRVMLVVESKKEKGQIISKRILSHFERLFDESFQEDTQKAIYKYYVVDMDEFPKTISQFVGIMQQSNLQQNRESKVEREGILQMRVTERHASKSPSNLDKKSGFEKKRFVLTQDDLIYCDKKDDKNISCIPLLCIEDIYVHDLKKDKYENVWFFFDTASETYNIKCNSDLDFDLWINSLIHCTNLAKEANILKERSKKIEQVQTFLFDLASKNSIFEPKFVLADKRQLDRAFSIIENNLESFFPHTGAAKEELASKAAFIIQPLKNFVVSFLEAKRLKPDGLDNEAFKGKLNECMELLTTKVPISDSAEITLTELIGAESDQDRTEFSSNEELFDKIAKTIDDLFYNLQRTSVSNNIFLEQYYSRLEIASLNQFEGIIV